MARGSFDVCSQFCYFLADGRLAAYLVRYPEGFVD